MNNLRRKIYAATVSVAVVLGVVVAAVPVTTDAAGTFIYRCKTDS